MKKLFYIFFFLTILSCSRGGEEQISQKLNGFWFNEDKILLFRDSVMMHPIYEAPGLFEFTYNNEMLIVKNMQEDFENIYDTCFVKLEKENEFTLIIDNDTSQFFKYIPLETRKFNKLFFEIEPCDGTCPVFEVEIFSDGKVIYNGKKYTEIIGLKEYKLDNEIINEINDLLEVIKIIDYPKDKSSRPLGSPRFNLLVEYPNEITISIKDGLFQGKYENIIKYFYFFERQLMN
ncbi:DUF6438 domain-containing protein [Echinicola shivajiensis]|uniref:DUF6438 domain-containing protein n=1 Tax=Echinicola shivajiensis TaxID=1035916 RepID=UPI001BFC3161|nr:DUF6438 domain-containing protein [Echinicola shivajiensis]